MSRFVPLRVRGFRRYLSGQLLSVTGSWVQVVALTSFIVRHDAHALGLVVTLQFLPMVLAPVFGAIADRVDRRRLLMAAEAGLGATAIVYAALALLGGTTVGSIAVVAALWGLLNALDTPTRQAFLTDLVPVSAASQAGPLTGVVFLTGMALGSAAGAMLFDSLGLAACCLINAASYALDLAILRTIRVVPRPRTAVSVRPVPSGTGCGMSAPRPRYAPRSERLGLPRC